jgi:uncharacterized protein YdeI (YjbR/CyaY-like superfamily)
MYWYRIAHQENGRKKRVERYVGKKLHREESKREIGANAWHATISLS